MSAGKHVHVRPVAMPISRVVFLATRMACCLCFMLVQMSSLRWLINKLVPVSRKSKDYRVRELLGASPPLDSLDNGSDNLADPHFTRSAFQQWLALRT